MSDRSELCQIEFIYLIAISVPSKYSALSTTILIEEIRRTNTDNIKLHSPTTKSDELSFQSVTIMSMFMLNITIPDLF
jgi:hypothetical protein